MKKIIILLVLMTIGFAGFSQYTYIAQRYRWLAGMFEALNIPSGSGPADFQNLQSRKAGAMYYDSLGIDSGLYIWSGLSWNQAGSGGGGTTYYPGEGLAMSNDSLHLGGLIGFPSLLYNQRTINVNRNIIHWTNGIASEAGGSFWQFSYRPYSPFQFISQDTVTVNDVVQTIGRPLSGIYARRTVYYNSGIYKTQQSYGHYFGQTMSWQDSVVMRNDGMDYQQAVIAEQRYKPRGSGYQVIRMANGAGNDARKLHANPTFLSNTYYDAVDNASTDTLRSRGVTVGIVSYLVAATGSGKIRADEHVYFQAGNLVNSNAHFNRTVVLARQGGDGPPIVDTAYFLWDTLRTGRSVFHNLVLGAGDSTQSGYQFKVYGTTWQKGAWRYTDGSEGNLKVLTSDANGNASWQTAGAGSTPSLQDVVDVDNTVLSSAIFMDQSNLIFNWNASPPGITFSSGISQPASTNTYLQNSTLYDSTITFVPAAGGPKYDLDGSLITADRHIFFPNNSGTLALLSDIAGAGGVSASGTPVNHDWAVWTSAAAIKGMPITASRAVVTDANGDPAASATTAAQVGYLSTATSDIQGQIDGNRTGSRLGVYYWNDFFSSISDRNDGSGLVSTAVGTGAVSSFTATLNASRPGIARLASGTTNTGRLIVGAPSPISVLGNGAYSYETALTVPVLSNATDRYQFIAGFYDVNSAANQTDGVYFLYDEGGVSTSSAASANWQVVTSSNSARTFTTTSTAVSNAAYQTLRIEVNAAGTSVGFYIDDVLAATHTTNIPTTITRITNYGYFLIKSAGTTNVEIFADFMRVKNVFTTAR